MGHSPHYKSDKCMRKTFSDDFGFFKSSCMHFSNGSVGTTLDNMDHSCHCKSDKCMRKTHSEQLGFFKSSCMQFSNHPVWNFQCMGNGLPAGSSNDQCTSLGISVHGQAHDLHCSETDRPEIQVEQSSKRMRLLKKTRPAESQGYSSFIQPVANIGNFFDFRAASIDEQFPSQSVPATSNNISVPGPPIHNERMLSCPKCYAISDFSKQQLYSKDGYRNIHCSECKRQARSLHWKCSCGILWHQCLTHSNEPATHATSRDVRRNKATAANQCMQSHYRKGPSGKAMPKRKVQKYSLKYRPMPSTASGVSPPARQINFKAKDCPGLAAKFPHLCTYVRSCLARLQFFN